jgi:hypothetical protein
MISTAHGLSWKAYCRRYLVKATGTSTTDIQHGEADEVEEIVEEIDANAEVMEAVAMQPGAEELMQGFGSLWGDPLLITGQTDSAITNGENGEESIINGDIEADTSSVDGEGVVAVDYDEDILDEDGVAAYPDVVLYDAESDQHNDYEDEEEGDEDLDGDQDISSSSSSSSSKKKRFSDDLAETCLMRCRLCGQETIPKSFHKHLEMRHQMSKAEYGPLTYVRKTFHRCHLCGAVMNFTRDSIGGHCRKVRRFCHRRTNLYCRLVPVSVTDLLQYSILMLISNFGIIRTLGNLIYRVVS